jgi:hypothetical protein
VAIGILALAGASACAQDDFGTLVVSPDVHLVGDDFYIGFATAIEAADLDRDGHTDLTAIVVQEGFKISGIAYVGVTFADAEGRFETPIILDAGVEPAGLAVADVNGDGLPDICTTDATSNTAIVIVNEGERQFSPGRSIDVGDEPRAVRAADFNADDRVDLAVLNSAARSMSILLGDGTGNFTGVQEIDVPGQSLWGHPLGQAVFHGPGFDVGDIDGDGDLDIVSPAIDTARILLNDGAGAFTLSEAELPVANPAAYDLVVTDLDADGDEDVAVVAPGDHAQVVTLLFNNGDGTQWAQATLGSGEDCPGCFTVHISIDAGDLDADGLPEIVVGQFFGERYTLYRNLGAGRFGEPEYRPVTWGSSFVELMDVDDDGAEDYVALADVKDIRIHLNDGHGEIRDPVEYPPYDVACCQSPQSMAASDLDKDGDLDLAIALANGDWPYQLNVIENVNNEEFVLHHGIPIGEPGLVFGEWIEAGDLNADGLDDLVMASRTNDLHESGTIWVLFNKGGLRFGEPEALDVGERLVRQIHLADMDGDSDLDLVGWEVGVLPEEPGTDVMRSVMVGINDGAGSFDISHVEVMAKPFDAQGGVAPADLDADGVLEVVTTVGVNDPPGWLAVLENDGRGGLTLNEIISVPVRPRNVVAGDFDADGDDDIALMAVRGSLDLAGLMLPYLQVFHAEGGKLTLVQEFDDTQFITARHMLARDVDSDGQLDLILAMKGNNLAVHLGDAGLFEAPKRLAIVGDAVALGADDLDADGDIDIAAAGVSYGDKIEVLWNGKHPDTCPADLNADGALDILDFIAFQLAFQAGDMTADCDADGILTNPLDFICFQQLFLAGCD